MKELIKKGFILGLGAASLTKKKTEQALKNIAKDAGINRKEAEVMAKNMLKEVDKDRKRIQKICC